MRSTVRSRIRVVIMKAMPRALDLIRDALIQAIQLGVYSLSVPL